MHCQVECMTLLSTPCRLRFHVFTNLVQHELEGISDLDSIWIHFPEDISPDLQSSFQVATSFAVVSLEAVVAIRG